MPGPCKCPPAQVQAFGHPLSPYASRVFSTVAGAKRCHGVRWMLKKRDYITSDLKD